MAARWLLFLLLLLPSVSATARHEGATTACAAVDSLARLVDFFSRNSGTFDADAYFGLFLASLPGRARQFGLAESVRSSCDDSRLVELERTIAKLDQLLVDFRVRATTSTLTSNGRGLYDKNTYLQICRPLEPIIRALLKPGVFRWRYFDPNSSLNFSRDTAVAWLAANRMKLNDYNENIGDVCFRTILAAQRRGCVITPSCGRLLLTASPTFGYRLTHQLYYWVIGLTKSCDLRLSNGRTVDQTLLHGACRRAFVEHSMILTATAVSNGYSMIDLALEQAALCSFLGFREFINESTVMLLRRLQNQRTGCFNEGQKAGTDIKKSSNDASATVPGRMLMHDVLIEGVCSSHTSGLAAAYFALYLSI